MYMLQQHVKCYANKELKLELDIIEVTLYSKSSKLVLVIVYLTDAF